MTGTSSLDIELQHQFQAPDVERIGSGLERVDTRASSESWGGATVRTFSILVKYVSNQSQSSTAQRGSNFTHAQDEFLKVVIGKKLDASSPSSLDKACKWYCSFLECKISLGWVSLFRPVLSGVNKDSIEPDHNDIDIAFRFLTEVASECQNKESLALTDIVDTCYNIEGLMTETDEDRSVAKQLAFASIGWLSILFSPEPCPNEKCLQILDPADNRQNASQETPHRQTSRARLRTITTYKETLENVELDQPLHRVLRRFGNILPKCNRDPSTQDALRGSSGRNDGWIDLSLVCFHTFHRLHRDDAIQVEWTDYLANHLEFDRGAKILKLFRFPSLCFLMCQHPHAPLLSKTFRESAASNDSRPIQNDDVGEYFKEVILSLRLIFGQRQSSCQDFNTEAHKWNQAWNSSSELAKQPVDPLLPIICGNMWNSEAARCIYDELDADPPSNHYRVNDFPYLGKRINELQSYVRAHKPHNLWALWRDRRDISRWWAFWPAIIIAVATFVFMLLQTVLQIIQVVYAHQQLTQSPSPQCTPP